MDRLSEITVQLTDEVLDRDPFLGVFALETGARVFIDDVDSSRARLQCRSDELASLREKVAAKGLRVIGNS